MTQPDESEGGASTDRDQDSLDPSSDESDDLKMDDDHLNLFRPATVAPTTTTVTNPLSSSHIHHRHSSPPPNPNDRKITKSKLESTINRSLTLRNPGELISDFYISNMNYAMRYSVEYIQSVAKDKRRQREHSDSFINLDTVMNRLDRSTNRLFRSVSVDRLYAVRREHIRLVWA